MRRFSGFSVVVGTILVAATAGGEPVVNGGFEDTSGGRPEGWQWHCPNGCAGSLDVDTEVKAEGGQAVRLASESKRAPHVYCGLAQDFRPLFPGITYRISFRAKGRGVGACWYGGGSGWRVRHGLPQGDFDWREFGFEWTAPGNRESFHFRVNVDSVTEALWIDDVRVTSELDDQQLLIRAVGPGESPFVPIFRIDPVSVDGDLGDWASLPAVGGQPFKLSDAGGRIDAAVRIAWSNEALYLAVETEDSEIVPSPTPEGMYDFDSVQVALDAHYGRSPHGYGPDDAELGFAPSKEGPRAHAWKSPECTVADIASRVQYAVVHRDGKLVYEAAIPWAATGLQTVGPETTVGLNLLVNDRDNTGDRVYAEWTEGIGRFKRPASYKTLVLTEGPWVRVSATPEKIVRSGYTKLEGVLFTPQPFDGEAVLTAGEPASELGRQQTAFTAGVSQCVYFVTGGDLTVGVNPLALSVSGGATEFAGKAQVVRSDEDEKALKRIAEQEARIPQLEAQLAAAKAEGIPVFYPQADFIIGRMFCRYCRDDVARKRYERAVQVAGEVKELFDRAEREMRGGVAVPVWRIGTEKVRDGSLWGTCVVGDKEEERPVFLTGYGHFSPVVEAIPTLAEIGCNVIQIEIGPRVVREDMSVDEEAIQSHIVAALDRARDHGVSVCLLLSPHYFPGWAFEKWPEIGVPSGFLRNTVDAPQVRNIYEKFLRTIIPMVKDHPALNSICLSNEPVSTSSPNDPFRLPLWREYVKAKHGSIEVVNELYGTRYASFDDVPHPKMRRTDPPAAYYDAVRFNQERFAEWHAWMAGVVHESAPELPCHAKVMPLVWGRRTILWGTDPWEFAQLSQYNGNDCYFLPHSEEPPWQSKWQIQNMYYDLQRSMKKVPVFNTENHIISDREQRYVSPDHIYAAIWQGAIHGQAGSTTWAWQRTYDAKSDFEGLILHRAGCTAAMSRCALDLMRLSREVSALQNVEPRVAILYSNAAIVHDDRASDMRNRVYEALNFCGVPIGFVTDEQVAAGWLEKYDCLIVAGSKSVLGDALEAIRAYKKKGGRVVAYGKSNMTADEYLRPVKRVKVSMELAGTLEGEALRDALLEQLKKADIVPMPVFETLDGKLPFGVEWRTAHTDDHAMLTNMINLTREPIAVRLFIAPGTNLFTQERLESLTILEPNRPVMCLTRYPS